MHVTRTERPARAEALARAEPVRRLHGVTVLVVVIGIVVTGALVAGSFVVHDRNEDRLLEQRGHEAAAVAASSINGLQGQMAAASIAAESGAGRFQQLMSPLVGTRRSFVSGSVWPLGPADPQPLVVVGAAPALLAQSADARRAFLADAARRNVVSIRDLLGGTPRRLGYAYAVPGARSVAYLEATFPRDRHARIASDTAFADLDYALYLGTQARPSHLLASRSGEGLHADRTTSEIVGFGDSKILLVVSPRGELGGSLLAALPWVLAALGILLTIVAAFLAERLIRRRERAEELSRRLEEVADENAALYASQRNIAQQLQRSLMANSLPHFAWLESAGRYEAGVAGTEVGGDWYDVLPIADDRVVFSVGDVCGRGLSAAVLMASLRYSIRAYALEHADPAGILDRLSAVMDTTADDQFATVICGTLDATAGTLTVARAGHPDLLVVDRDGAHYLEAPLGPPVGVDNNWSYDAVTCALPDDATLIAYTDGLVERRREHLDVGFERLRVAALAELPLPQLVAYLVDALVDEGDDDVAVLGLHWTGARAVPDPPELARAGVDADGATRSITLPSRPEAASSARSFVRETLRTWQLDDTDQISELLVDELVSNVVCHVGSAMEIRARRGASSLRFEVRDASTQLPIRRHPNRADEHGRGIMFVEMLSADWGVDVHHDGKTIWFDVPVVAADGDGNGSERAVE